MWEERWKAAQSKLVLNALRKKVLKADRAQQRQREWHAKHAPGRWAERKETRARGTVKPISGIVIDDTGHGECPNYHHCWGTLLRLRLQRRLPHALPPAALA
eukprot:4356460-Pyramimonas_sp.AAC.1